MGFYRLGPSGAKERLRPVNLLPISSTKAEDALEIRTAAGRLKRDRITVRETWNIVWSRLSASPWGINDVPSFRMSGDGNVWNLHQWAAPSIIGTPSYAQGRIVDMQAVYLDASTYLVHGATGNLGPSEGAFHGWVKSGAWGNNAHQGFFDVADTATGVNRVSLFKDAANVLHFAAFDASGDERSANIAAGDTPDAWSFVAGRWKAGDVDLFLAKGSQVIDVHTGEVTTGSGAPGAVPADIWIGRCEATAPMSDSWFQHLTFYDHWVEWEQFIEVLLAHEMFTGLGGVELREMIENTSDLRFDVPTDEIGVQTHNVFSGPVVESSIRRVLRPESQVRIDLVEQ